MDTLIVDTQEIIEESLKKSIDYNQYIQLTQEMVEKNSTTGNDKTETFIEYTKLNQKRMNRWNKTLKISKENQESISKFDGETTWLVLSETWCGDAAHILPVMNKITALNSNINLHIVLRDENEELMDAFLTNGGRSIPKLIALNEDKEVIGTFGPRPSEATQMVNDYKEKHGQLTPEFKQELQVWYNKDKGQNTINDLLQLLKD